MAVAGSIRNAIFVARDLARDVRNVVPLDEKGDAEIERIVRTGI